MKPIAARIRPADSSIAAYAAGRRIDIMCECRNALEAVIADAWMTP